MPRAVMLTLMLLITLPAAAAEDVEALEADFLDYLASMEAEDDDWTLLAADAEPPPRQANDTEAPKPARPAPKKTQAPPAGDLQ